MSGAISGATRVAGVIGDPVAHSRSPAIMNAAFTAAGLDWVYVAFPARAGRGSEAVKAARDLGLVGLNVTMPFKAEAAGACDELTPAAMTLGAVNVVTVDPAGRLLGSSTDGAGFVRAVREEGLDPAGRTAVVCGAGGAARAIVVALGDVGAHVTVAARRRDAADTAAGLVAGAAAVTLDEVDPAAFDLVVNATPLGMKGEDGPVAVDRLTSSQLVVDTVYHPLETPFLAACRARGVPCTNGLGMLVHQAALAFEEWTGITAPLDAMRAAVMAEPV